jgi:hypothetical protein
MSVTISNKIYSSFGSKNYISFDLVVGAYATNGVSLTPAMLGWGSIDLLLAERKGGVLYSYVYSTSKIKVYRQYIATAGALSKPSIISTDGTISITGGESGAGSAALWIDPESAAGKLAVSGVTGPTVIPAATFGITKMTMAVQAAIAFTGDANAARAFAECYNTFALTDTVRCIAIGV